jgi:hypothetical protein
MVLDHLRQLSRFRRRAGTGVRMGKRRLAPEFKRRPSRAGYYRRGWQTSFTGQFLRQFVNRERWPEDSDGLLLIDPR